MNIFKKVFLKHSLNDKCTDFFKDVNAFFEICVMVPNTYIFKCPRMFLPCEKIFFPQKQRPEGPAECKLTELSLPEACSDPLDHGCFPVIEKLK